MTAQNYNAEDAFHRWRDGGLSVHLRVMRRKYLIRRLLASVSTLEHLSDRTISKFVKGQTLVFGRVTWGVFARAFWAIYQPGKSPIFFGSVIYSDDPADEDSPALFEIAEYSRRVMEDDVPLNGIEEYAAVIRDDHSLPPRIVVPTQIATKPGVYLQSIGIQREKLPRGYLHHRLVPIIVHRSRPYASIIPQRYWGGKFRALWCAGDPLLSEQVLAGYRAEWPEIEP